MVHFFLHISVQQNVLFYCLFFFGTDQRKETKYPQFIQIFIFLQLLMKQNSNLKEWEKKLLSLSPWTEKPQGGNSQHHFLWDDRIVKL